MAFVQNKSGEVAAEAEIETETEAAATAVVEPSAKPTLIIPPDPPSFEEAREQDQLRHANDDAKLVGDTLRSLQFRPSSVPYIVAFIASVIYAAALVWVMRLDLIPLLTEGDPDSILKIAIGSCPFVLFFLLAAFSRQVQRVRHSADAMSRVAFRLVTPAASAQEDLVSLSQTVRMEVASLGDGIERGIVRIGDMELVASDLLLRLEQAYASADAKMHALTRRLTNERESLEAYAERVGDTILNSRKQIDLDLKMAGEQITARVRETAMEIMSSVEAQAKTAIGEAEDALAEKARELGVLLSGYSDSVRAAAESANNETESMRQRFLAQNVDNVNYMREVLAASEREFAAMQERVVESFGVTTNGVAQAMQDSERTFIMKAEDLLNHLQWFEGDGLARLAATSTDVEAASHKLNETLAGFEDKIASMTTGATLKIETLTGGLQTVFEDQIGKFDSQTGRNISILHETLESGIGELNKTLIEGLRNFSVTLGESRTSQEMEAAISELRSILQANLGNFRSELQGACDALSGLFAASTERIAEDVSRASQSTVARVQDAGAQLAVSVQDTGAVVLADLTGLNRDLLQSIGDLAAGSARAVHEAARQPLADIHRENQRFKEEAISSLKKLSELNNVIRSTIAAAEKRLGSVSHSLVNQTENFVKLVGSGHLNANVPVDPTPPAAADDPSIDLVRALRSMADLTETQRMDALRADLAPEHRGPPQAKSLDAALLQDELGHFKSAAVAAPLPPRDSPDWMSSLLARASRGDQTSPAAKAPENVSEVVNLELLGDSLSAFARGGLSELDVAIYKAAGLAIFRRIQARYASEPGFRASADRMAAAFNEAYVAYVRSGEYAAGWAPFVEANLAGLMTAHATGVFKRKVL